MRKLKTSEKVSIAVLVFLIVLSLVVFQFVNPNTTELEFIYQWF